MLCVVDSDACQHTVVWHQPNTIKGIYENVLAADKDSPAQ